MLLLNAAAGLTLMGKADSLANGVAQARLAIEDGRAIEQLRALIRTQNAAPEAGLAKLAALISD